MFSQRQWDELSAFAASFASPGQQGQQPQDQQHPNGSDNGNAHSHGHQGGAHHPFFQQQQQQQPPPPPPLYQQHQPPTPSHQQQHQQQQDFFQHAPQAHAQPGQQILHQQEQNQQPQHFHHQFQYGVAHQPQWHRFGGPQPMQQAAPAAIPHGNRDVNRDFDMSHGSDMDWTAGSDYDSTFQRSDFGMQQHGGGMRSMDFRGSAQPLQMDEHQPVGDASSGSNRVGVGRLVAQFENKNYSPALPPRPTTTTTSTTTTTTNNAVTSPIAINQQYPSQHPTFDEQPTSPFGFETPHPTNSFASNSFQSTRFDSPSDTHFGSYGTTQSRVASPMAASPGPIAFGSFHDASRITSPGAGPTSDPFGSIDFMTGTPVTSTIAQSPMPSPMPTTPASSVPGGTPGFAIWRPPEQQASQQFTQQVHQKRPSTFQLQPSPKARQPGRISREPEQQPPKPASSVGGFLRPAVPTTPKPAMNTANQFILELVPGSKLKGKAPPKPPKPRAPKPTSLSLAPTVKQEPMSPSAFELPTPMGVTHDEPHEPLTPHPANGNRPSREQVPAQAWEGFKSTIRDLYLEQRKPLKEVMSIMAEKYNFQATPKMYKTRFSQWGFVKNNTEEEVKRLLSMKFQRDAEGKVSEFVRNGKVVDLGTYLKRKGVTEYDLVDFDLSADLPSHIRCRTPTPPPAPEYLKSPDLLRAQELVVSNIRKAFLQCRQVELEMERQISWSSIMVWGAPSSELLTEANFFFEAGDVDQGGQSLMNAFNQLEVDLKQLSPQGIIEVMLGMVRRDPGLMTALCKYVAAFSTTNYDRSHPLRQIFTCLYEVQQKHGAATLSDLLAGSTPLIADELEAMYGHRHPYVARTWIDLALVYEHKNVERLEKLVLELRVLHRQMEQQQDAEQADLLSLRCAIAQILYAINPEAGAAKHAANDLWKDMKKMKLVFKMRDPRPHTYCYHCPVKVDPWSKRCRRRYDSEVELLEKLVEIRIHPYFEEDFHMTQHEMDPQDAWAAAIAQQQMNGNRWGGYI